MKPVYVKPHYQLIAAMVITILLGGGYFYFRYSAYDQKIKTMQKESAGFKRRIANADTKPPSQKKIQALKKQLQTLVEQQKNLDEMFAPIRQKLAPMNSQALKLKISQLARESGVYVRSNVKVQHKTGASSKPLKPQLPAESASWLEKMSPNSVFYRPMQRLSLEGDYQSIFSFIHGLSSLPYQVTVVKLSITKASSDSPPGYPQRLMAEVILAL